MKNFYMKTTLNLHPERPLGLLKCLTYRTKASVNQVGGDGYERENPLVWIGDNIVHSRYDNKVLLFSTRSPFGTCLYKSFKSK